MISNHGELAVVAVNTTYGVGVVVGVPDEIPVGTWSATLEGTANPGEFWVANLVGPLEKRESWVIGK